jgi:hypothetical protein
MPKNDLLYVMMNYDVAEYVKMLVDYASTMVVVK